MERMTWTTVDKSLWGSGPWQDEPDKEQWADEATGFACLIVRNGMGALCGYVGVPEGHPWHGADRWSIDARAHGGINYSAPCQEGPEDATVCHVPAPGEPGSLWWVGFDCSHGWDYSPVLRELDALLPVPLRLPVEPDKYRDIRYVRDWCGVLALQAKDIETVLRT